MKISKQEIEEELDHKRQIVVALIRRRRPLELQAAQKGLSVPPEILTEISMLSDQIRTQEEEISRLETLAAEGQLSIVEAEYRVMVARTWDTSRGKPTLAGSAELELSRLRMGLLPEKAQQIEREVRIGLAEEAFSSLDIHFLKLLPTRPEPKKINDNSSSNDFTGSISGGNVINVVSGSVRFFSSGEDPYESSLRVIGRSIRLDNPTALRLFLTILPHDLRLDLEEFNEQIIRANRVWNYQDDREGFDWFIRHLEKALEEREIEIQGQKNG